MPFVIVCESVVSAGRVRGGGGVEEGREDDERGGDAGKN